MCSVAHNRSNSFDTCGIIILYMHVIRIFTFLASTIHVFYSTECSSSGLFAGAATEAATCPQEFTGGVRTSSSNGIACYSGLTADSTAVFMCGVDGANCTGSCEAVCVCSPEQTRGEWSASFEAAVCLIPTSGSCHVHNYVYTRLL